MGQIGAVGGASCLFFEFGAAIFLRPQKVLYLQKTEGIEECIQPFTDQTLTY